MSVACRLRPDAQLVCHFLHSLITTLHVHPAYLSGGATMHLSLSNRHTCLTLTLHLSRPSFARHELLAPIASSCACRKARTAGSCSSKKTFLRSESSAQEDGSQVFPDVRQAHFDEIAGRDGHVVVRRRARSPPRWRTERRHVARLLFYGAPTYFLGNLPRAQLARHRSNVVSCRATLAGFSLR